MRGQVLEHGSTLAQGGWAQTLVIRQGLAAWMEAWPRRQTTVAEPPPTAPTSARAEPSLPAFLHPQVTDILVTMILNTRSEVLL